MTKNEIAKLQIKVRSARARKIPTHPADKALISMQIHREHPEFDAWQLLEEYNRRISELGERK